MKPKTPTTKAGRGNAPSTPRLPPKRRLASSQDVRQFVADIANRVNRDELDQAKAKTLGYLMQILNSIIATGELEKRLEYLELQAKENSR